MSLLFVFTYIHKAKLTLKCFEQFNLFLNIVCFDQNVLARLILNACFGFNIMLSQWNCDYQLRHLQCSRLDLSPEALQTQWETEKVLSGSYPLFSAVTSEKLYYHQYLSPLSHIELSEFQWSLHAGLSIIFLGSKRRMGSAPYNKWISEKKFFFWPIF